MSGIIVKEECIEDDTDVVSIRDRQIKCEPIEDNSQIHMQQETEEKKVQEDPLPNLLFHISRHETTSVYIKEELPEDSSENANEGVVQNKTPTIEECSSSSEPNAGELLPRESVKTKGFCKDESQPSFPNNSQNPSQYEAVLYSINRLTSFNAENGEYETPQNWEIVNWMSRQSDRLAYKEAIAEAQDNQKFAKLRQKYLKWLENESASHREIQLSKMRNRGKVRRNSETTEQREERLRKLRQNQAQRLASETPEQKAHRLQQMRVTAAHRIANETPEQRNVRLIKMRECAAKRLANESPEKREYRLKQLRLYRSRRIAKMQRLDLQNINVPALSSSVSSEQEHDFNLHTSHQLCQSETTDTTSISHFSKFCKSAKGGNMGRKSQVPVSNSEEAQSVSD